MVVFIIYLSIIRFKWLKDTPLVQSYHHIHVENGTGQENA